MLHRTRIVFAVSCICTLAVSVPALSAPLLTSSTLLVSEARKYMGTNPTARKRLWCATFMNMVLAKTGYTGTNSDAAKSFAYYGRRINEPRVGAIAVLSRGRRGGHVGVVSGIDNHGNPIIISGNHNKRVGEAVYPRARVIAYVMPTDRRAVTTQFAARSQSISDLVLDSPIVELLAAIEAEQNRAEQAMRPVAPLQPASPHHPVRQVSDREAVPSPSQRDLPLDPFLVELLGLKDQPQPAPRSATPPQRQRRVQQTPAYVVSDTGPAKIFVSGAIR